MAKLTIDTGTAGNPATGDTLRTAMTKVNANFTEIYNELGSDGTFSNISFDGNTISTDNTNGDLTIDPNGTGRLVIDATITNTTTNSNITISPNGTGALDVDTSRIINVTDPTSAQDAATKNYVDTQLASSDHNFTFVGDDSTGTAVTQGETFKFAGTQNITTAVSGDTLTITGPDLSNYLNSTQITVSGNKISTTESNANIELDPNGSGDVIVNSGDVLPAADNTQYLGSASKRWHTLYVGPGSINIAGASITNVGGILKIPGGIEGTQGLSGLFVLPSDLPYGGENDVLGSLFNYDGTTVFYEQSTWTNIKYYVENVAGYSGWVVGDALPTDPVTGTFDDTSGNTIVPATFSATTSGNNLVSLKLLTGGSGLGAGATDNILAFRVGDPITTYAVTPYGGVLGTANPQGTIQSDSTFTGSVNVNSNLFLHDSVDAYGTISMNSNKITDLGTPTATTDAATKGYVDTQLSSSSHNITFVGDDSTGTAVTQGETFKFAGTQNITTAVSGDTLTITGPDLSSYATQSYVTSQGYITNSTTTIVGDDSTGTTINSGETIKIAGATNITTAVSGDTLTITGTDLSSYLQNTGTQTIDNLTFNDNIISTSSNADLILQPGGTGKVRIATDTISLGNQAGTTNQSNFSVAIGSQAGQITQGISATAVGNDAGQTTQGAGAVAVGGAAGYTGQGADAVAVGNDAGNTTQGASAVAIGDSSGSNTQGNFAVAIGFNAGTTSQGISAVAIGDTAGQTNQGASAIAIGGGAGETNQAANSIVLNATGNILNNIVEDVFIVKPVRNATGSAILQYDSTTGEITHSTNITNITIDNLTFNDNTIGSSSNADINISPGGTGNVAVARPLVMASFTTTQRNALTAANGMMIYNTTTNQFEGYENGAWISLKADTADAG
jgi:hypothetical protein